MDPLLDTRLRALETKIDEQHRIIIRLGRAQRRAMYARYAYWILLIALAYASYHFVSPYIGQLGAAYGIGNGDSSSLTSQNLLDQLKTYQQQNR